MSPKVIISANVSHYYYAARTLYKANFLKSYICAIAFTRNPSKAVKLLPEYWRNKITARSIIDIDPHLVHSIWLPELLQRGLPALKLISVKRGNWLNDHLYDLFALRWVVPCDIFHSLPGIGLFSARKAKKTGAVIICDERQEHPDFQLDILKEEYHRLGIFNPPSHSLSINRIKTTYNESDYLILPSTYAKDTFINAGYPPEKIFVLPYGVDRNHFLPTERNVNAQKDREHIFRVIYTGSVIPRKGVHYLVQAFQELNAPHSELVIIGDVPEIMRPFMQEAARKNSNIRFLGHIPKIELARHYNQASVFVLPSLADSFGLVCLEAMACGLPVIVTQNTGSKEAIQDGESGFIVPIRDVEILKEKLTYLYEHPDKRSDMGRAASANANAFTWEKYGEKLIDIYAEVLNRKQQHRSGRQ